MPQLKSIIEFIYLGTTNILESDVISFKSALESLRISLDDGCDTSAELEEENETIEHAIPLKNHPERRIDQEEEQFEAIIEPEVPKVKEEPVSDEEVIKEEEIKPKIELPPNIQVKTSPKIASVSSITQKPVIRIRSPSSINEKVEDPQQRTLRFVPKLPTVISAQSQAYIENNRKIQEISKRLSKAILIRRVKKSDGSFHSERSPIKIVQGMRIQKIQSKSLPATPVPVTVTQDKRKTFHIENRPVAHFKCSHCNKAFSVNKRRNAHEKFCFRNPTRPSSQCPYCPMVLCNPAYIQVHIRKVHGVDENGVKIQGSKVESD